MHHNIFYEITNRCSYMQSILFHCYVHSTCFGCCTHPSSGVQFLTASTATGTDHSIVSTAYSQCGLQATLGVSSWLHIAASVGYFIESENDISPNALYRFVSVVETDCVLSQVGAAFYIISTDVLLTTSAQAVSFIMAAVSHRKPASATVCRDSNGGRGHDKGDSLWDDCSSS